jgi:hypothetical protein
VEFAGISDCAFCPYANSGGMVRTRSPPTCIPTIPSSQPVQSSVSIHAVIEKDEDAIPLITSPLPKWKEN